MSILEKQTNIALVGVGYWGKNLARNFSELGALYCLCDPNLKTNENIAAQYNVPVLSFEQILQDEKISAVAIVTPATTHYELAKKALEAGKHVFVEKPMTLNLDHAQELCRLAKAKKRKLMVGHLLQYHPVFGRLKELVHTGALGQMQYLYSNRLDLGKIYTKKDVLWNLAPHDLSMILSLVGSIPTKINATASCNLRDGVSDFATIHMNFPNKVKAHLSVSWLNPFKEQKLTVVGSKGMAVFDDTQIEWKEKLAMYTHKIEMKSDSIITVKEAPQFIEVKKSEPLRNECQHFINCIEQNQTPITDGEEALRVIEILIQARALCV
jgi:UDP-2-acetamido-3-amino-2,3-dideoxy-glucuronate N-acetyltransferase